MPDLPLSIVEKLISSESDPVLVADDADRTAVQVYLQNSSSLSLHKETILQNNDRQAYLCQIETAQYCGLSIKL